MPPYRSYRTYTIACYTLAAIIVAVLFAENFVFSSNFSLLGFRHIDDVAFQSVLRQSHLDLRAGNFARLFNINDYAYGWIFWAPMVLVTYPLFLISQSYSIDWPLIVAPREISLLFTVMSMLVLRKALNRLGTPEWACASGVLMLALFPATAYFSMRFGTVNAVAFFSLLAVYLAIRNEPPTIRGTTLVALSLAIAGAIKLSGLLIMPLVVVLVLRRMVGVRIVPILAAAFVVFFVALATLTNPQFLLLPFNSAIWTEYWATLTHFIEVTRVPSGPSHPVVRLWVGIFGTTLNALIATILAMGWIVVVVRDKYHRADFLGILVVVGLAAAYLMLAVKNHLSIGSYFTSVSFLLLFGIAGYARFPRSIYLFSFLIALMITDAIGRAWVDTPQKLQYWNHFSYYLKKASSDADIAVSFQTVECIETKLNGAKLEHVFVDHSAPSTINALSYPTTCVSVAWNNLSPAGKYCDKSIDFLILDTQLAVGFLPVDKFEERIKSTDPKTAEAFKHDRQNRHTLMTSGSFGNQHFHLACDLGRIKVFKSDIP